jgi:hypothetical protein
MTALVWTGVSTERGVTQPSLEASSTPLRSPTASIVHAEHNDDHNNRQSD